MRVIAGALGGRNFTSPHTARTHPMSDRMRGALFTALGDISDLQILDAFAGSGALSFEAVSRGARATAIEIDKNAQQTITRAIRAFGIEKRMRLIRSSANAWLKTTKELSYDIVLCDPPYQDLQLSLIERLADCVRPDGLLVVSWPRAAELPTFPHFEMIRQRAYGEGQIAFYRRQTAAV